MNKLHLILAPVILTVSACAGNVIQTVVVPNTVDELYLTDKACPESRLNTPTEKYFVFRSSSKELGCYANIKSQQGYWFVVAGNRNITGEPQDYFYTYQQLVEARTSYNNALNAAILQVAPTWNQAPPTKVQIQPYTCVKSGAYTSCN